MTSIETLGDAALAYAYAEGWTPPEGEDPPGGGQGGAGTTFTIQDDGGLAQVVTGINFKGKPSSVTVEGGIATIDAQPSDVRILLAEPVNGANFSISGTDTTSQTPVLVPGFNLDMVPGDGFFFELEAFVKSSTYSAAKMSVLGPRGAVMSSFRAHFQAPHQFEVDGITPIYQGNDGGLDLDRFRYTVIRKPNDGPQRMGGFPGSVNVSVGTASASKAISSSGNLFDADRHEGAAISGTGIPANTYIAQVNSAASATLSQNATGSATVTANIQQLGEIPVYVRGSVFLGEAGSAGPLEVRLGQVAFSAGLTQVVAAHSRLLVSRIS